MGMIGNAAKALAKAAAKKAYNSAVHNIRNGASKNYCPINKGKHHMVQSDMGMGWVVQHCDKCGWFDHKKHQHNFG